MELGNHIKSLVENCWENFPINNVIYLRCESVGYSPWKSTDLSHSSPGFTVWGSTAFSCSLQ